MDDVVDNADLVDVWVQSGLLEGAGEGPEGANELFYIETNGGLTWQSQGIKVERNDERK